MHAHLTPRVEEMEDPEWNVGDADVDESSDTSKTGEGVNYWFSLDDSKDYVPYDRRDSTSTPLVDTSYARRSDTAS